MSAILILKTGALGDVLRTTALLPGIHVRHAHARVTWVTAPGAVDLVRLHPQVAEVVALDPRAGDELEAVGERLRAATWDWVVSLDDEEALCRLAASIPTRRLSGATWCAERGGTYTEDTGPWFDMGLLSVHGKQEADRRKAANTRSHPAILTDMLDLPLGRPVLPREPAAEAGAATFAAQHDLAGHGPVIGLNTGAGGRWRSKMLPPERAVELVLELHRRLEGGAAFLLLGGRDEAERNRGLAAALDGRVRLVDAGTENDLLRFAGLVSSCDLLITSDSLALHVAVAREVRVVAFFAPTSAAEIELWGLGEKVASTSPDYCSYRRDADTSSLTVERLAAAVLRQLP